ncbi:MAG: tungstate ABC transporter substrate-binding protein WtpA [Bacteroidales bacterium]|nr:tungstate ABC transporter substrate-binding protein WtpA [Bacteroidales bacterium]
MKFFISTGYYFIIACFLAALTCCDPGSLIKNDDQGKVIVFHAGSLSVPFSEVAEAFEKEHPGIEVLLEGAGSRECARKVTELGRPCDVLASSDYAVIEDILIPGHASWYIGFAGNEMCIAFNERSVFHERIHTDNWYRILISDSVVFGRSDPNLDPCGYRTLQLFQLAGDFYQIRDIAGQLAEKNREMIRPKEVDLLAMLESNTIDYIFVYRSMAEQHGLKYLRLPDEINLGKPEMAGRYATASVQISGNGIGQKIEVKGKPALYAVCLIDHAPHRDAALQFLKFLLSTEKGLAIIKKNGQPVHITLPDKYTGQVPPELIKKIQNE